MIDLIENRRQPGALHDIPAASGPLRGAFSPKNVHSNHVSQSPLTIARVKTAIKSGIAKFLQLFTRLRSTKPAADKTEPVVLVSFGKLPERPWGKMRQLLGKSVRPATADATMRVVHYDGVGRVLGFAETATDADIALLEKNLIEPLHRTRTAGAADRTRTRTEAVIALAALVERKMPDGPQKDTAARSLKENFLSRKTDFETLGTLFTCLRHNPALRESLPEIGAIMASINYVPLPTVVNDNYGRLFNSALARYAAEHPGQGRPEAALPPHDQDPSQWSDAIDYAYGSMLSAAVGLATADDRARQT